MNLQNIISAGRMMSVVLSLLGAIFGVVSFVRIPDGPELEMAFGVLLLFCGQALMLLIGRLARKISASDPSHRNSLGTATLAVGTLVASLGTASAALAWRDPFSWMFAIVGLAIFIDTLCLKIQLRVK